MAAIYSCDNYRICDKPFLTYHLSGGTTELLLVRKNKNYFDCEIVGGTKDLPAGQFIDRIGVKLGMSFPCGKWLDAAAVNYQGEKLKVRTCVNEGYINFSGEETRYARQIENGEAPEKIAYCVMKCIARSIKESIEYAKEKYSAENVLMVGGVSSSEMLRTELADIPGVFFAKPQYSTDNAVGVCEIGARWMD